MVNLTISISIPNITKYECIAFDVLRGAVTLRIYYGAGTTRLQDFVCYLNDTANFSTGIIVNPSPGSCSDTLLQKTGVGLVNSLTNSISAYRGAANHNAGLKALELRGAIDGWLDAAMAGS